VWLEINLSQEFSWSTALEVMSILKGNARALPTLSPQSSHPRASRENG
jgi:hypothetical protein